jgi:hypothetical protein
MDDFTSRWPDLTWLVQIESVMKQIVAQIEKTEADMAAVALPSYLSCILFLFVCLPCDSHKMVICVRHPADDAICEC